MRFFVDPAYINAIAEPHALGMVDGDTTNPTIILKSGGDIKEVIGKKCDRVSSTVPVETMACNPDDLNGKGHWIHTR